METGEHFAHEVERAQHHDRIARGAADAGRGEKFGDGRAEALAWATGGRSAASSSGRQGAFVVRRDEVKSRGERRDGGEEARARSVPSAPTTTVGAGQAASKGPTARFPPRYASRRR
jgi:hypothetical protein